MEKFVCKCCGEMFDEPKYIIGEKIGDFNIEFPVCPKCESEKIDFN